MQTVCHWTFRTTRSETGHIFDLTLLYEIVLARMLHLLAVSGSSLRCGCILTKKNTSHFLRCRFDTLLTTALKQPTSCVDLTVAFSTDGEALKPDWNNERTGRRCIPSPAFTLTSPIYSQRSVRVDGCREHTILPSAQSCRLSAVDGRGNNTVSSIRGQTGRLVYRVCVGADGREGVE